MKSKTRFPLWVWVVVPIVVVVATVVLLALLREGDPADRGVATALERIADEPSRFFGETVTVSGEVVEILGPRSLLISDRIITGDLLVVSSVPLREAGDQASNAPLTQGDTIRVTGEVRKFDLTAAEQRLEADLSEEALDAYAGTPAIIADSISLEPPGVLEEDARVASPEG